MIVRQIGVGSYREWESLFGESTGGGNNRAREEEAWVYSEENAVGDILR